LNIIKVREVDYTVAVPQSYRRWILVLSTDGERNGDSGFDGVAA